MGKARKTAKRLKKNQTGQKSRSGKQNLYVRTTVMPEMGSDAERACARKRSLTKTQARSGAAAMTAQHGKKFDYYRCDYCNGYHIGRRSPHFTGPDGKRHWQMEYFPVDQSAED